MVFRIGEELRRVIAANYRHTLGSSSAEKGDRERHARVKNILLNGNTPATFNDKQIEMLSTLRIKNLALVADVMIDFQPGLNVITGETGAGKSVLIGALTLLLGQRADRDLIRSGADACSVEAVFETSALGAEMSRFLLDNGLEQSDQQLIIKRTITTAGAS